MGALGSKDDEERPPPPKSDIRNQRRNAVTGMPSRGAPPTPSRGASAPPPREPERYREAEEDDPGILGRFFHHDDEDEGPRGAREMAAASPPPPPPPQEEEESGRPGDAVKCARKCALQRPKRALSPFNCFVRSVKTGQGDDIAMSVGRNCDMKTIADRWHSMSEAEKKPYNRLSGADKQRYSNDKKLYESIKSQVIRRPKNSYILFMRKFRRENRKQYPDPKEMTREGARAWKHLRPEEKHPFDSESLKDSKRYADEKRKYCNRLVLPRRNDTRIGRPSGQDSCDADDEEEDMDTTTDLND